MFSNYFATAINNLIKNKLYSAINIIGLAIGLAACIIMALYVQDENSYDQQWQSSDRIYRFNYTINLPSGPVKVPVAPLPARAAIDQFFSEGIELSTRTTGQSRIFTVGNVQYEDELIEVDRPFIDMFQLDVVSGSLESTLANTSNIALSVELAERYFGTRDPIGEILSIVTRDDRIKDYQVNAVYRSPDNTVLNIPTLTLLDETTIPSDRFRWNSANAGVYVQLQTHVNVEDIQARLPDLINQYVDMDTTFPGVTFAATDLMSAELQNMQALHLNSPWDTSRAGGNPATVLIFSIISALVLLIACINFTILTTAKATQRAREIAMRKVLGAGRKQLMVQFLGESFFVVLLAMALSLALVEIILPLFSSMVGKELAVNYSNPDVYLSLLALLLIAGFSGGLYPAFILSGFRPGNTLKANRSMETKGSASFTVDRRTKEIGLRKVMGAKTKNIVSLLIWQFSKPVLIANIIAWPLAIWAMINWLERFPYQISVWLLFPLCFIAGLIALLIATITVVSNTTRVARSNPIYALRYE